MSDLLDNFRQFPPKAKKITNSWNDRLRNTLGSLAEHSDGTRKEKTWPHQWRTDQSTAGAWRYDRRGTDRHRVPRLQRPPLAGSLPLVRREDARRRYRRRDERDRRLDTRRARNVLPHSPYRKRFRRLDGLDGCEPLSRHALRPRAQDVSGFGRGERYRTAREGHRPHLRHFLRLRGPALDRRVLPRNRRAARIPAADEQCGISLSRRALRRRARTRAGAQTPLAAGGGTSVRAADLHVVTG